MEYIKRKALKRSDWGFAGTEQFYYGNDKSRPARSMAIGIATDDSGKEQFIIEEIYQDIVDLSFTDKDIQILVNVWAKPMLVVKKQGRLIEHNAHVAEYRKCIWQLISSLDLNYIVYAFREFQLNRNGEKVGQYIRSISDTLKKQYGITFNLDLIEAVIAAYLYQISSSKSKIPEIVTADKQLIDILVADMIFQSLGYEETSQQYVYLRKKYTDIDIDAEINREICIRKYYGYY